MKRGGRRKHGVLPCADRASAGKPGIGGRRVRVLAFDRDWFLFARVLGEEWVIVSANRSDRPQPAERLEVPGLNLSYEREFGALFGSGNIRAGEGWLELPDLPRGGEVWR